MVKDNEHYLIFRNGYIAGYAEQGWEGWNTDLENKCEAAFEEYMEECGFLITVSRNP